MSEPLSNREPNPYRELSLLREVNRSPVATQRGLSAGLGISLGLANLLLKRVIRKGYVTVTKSGWRRRLYYLTPAGADQKMTLTTVYIGRFLDEYNRIKVMLREELAFVSVHRESRVALYGVGQFAELVYLAMKDLGVESVDVFHAGVPDREFLGMTVRGLDQLDPAEYERVVIAELGDVDELSASLVASGVPAQQVMRLFTLPASATHAEAEADSAVFEGTKE